MVLNYFQICEPLLLSSFAMAGRVKKRGRTQDSGAIDVLLNHSTSADRRIDRVCLLLSGTAAARLFDVPLLRGLRDAGVNLGGMYESVGLLRTTVHALKGHVRSAFVGGELFRARLIRALDNTPAPPVPQPLCLVSEDVEREFPRTTNVDGAEGNAVASGTSVHARIGALVREIETSTAYLFAVSAALRTGSPGGELGELDTSMSGVADSMVASLNTIRQLTACIHHGPLA